MSRVAYYLASLASLNTPATHDEIHKRAVEMYGSAIKGSAASCRGSLDRYVLLGRVKRSQAGMYWIDGVVDPIHSITSKLMMSIREIDTMRTRLRASEAEVERLKARIAELEARG